MGIGRLATSLGYFDLVVAAIDTFSLLELRIFLRLCLGPLTTTLNLVSYGDVLHVVTLDAFEVMFTEVGCLSGATVLLGSPSFRFLLSTFASKVMDLTFISFLPSFLTEIFTSLQVSAIAEPANNVATRTEAAIKSVFNFISLRPPDTSGITR